MCSVELQPSVSIAISLLGAPQLYLRDFPKVELPDLTGKVPRVGKDVCGTPALARLLGARKPLRENKAGLVEAAGGCGRLDGWADPPPHCVYPTSPPFQT